MRTHVFTYGSLMFAPVWQRVVRGDYRHASAHLDGHARHAIVGVDYPGLVACDGAGVDGLLYFDVAPHDLVLLDLFEGDEYRRAPVRVTLASGETLDADTYLYLLPQKLSAAPWLPEAFALDRFLGNYGSAPGGTV